MGDIGPLWVEMSEKEADYGRTPTVHSFCYGHGGTRPIQQILVANNGIAAVKCIRSIRKWAYETFGDEKAIRFTVMATPEDLAAGAEYIKLADRFVNVPGESSHNNYGNVELIVGIAEQCAVDAVWAGWGHASENPRLPDALARKGIAFLGPSAPAMRMLGNKIAATLLAQSVHVPTLPWSGLHVTIDPTLLQQAKEEIPDEIYSQCTVGDATEGLEVAWRLGFPVMIKVAEGGGGKGIRAVENEREFTRLFNQAQEEVPGSALFVMAKAEHCRHVEIQLLGDQQGSIVSLGTRDCTVQRRHQKILEEAPAIAASEELVKEMEASAIRLARLVNYQSAGTLEYLYMPASEGHPLGQYFFLELNPRLQVEHPCTESITHVNLPAAQLQIAMGIPLTQIPEIQALNVTQGPSTSTGPLDISIPRDNLHGHVIAARITAENPLDGFRPTSGKVEELAFQTSRSVWGYFSLGGRGGVHEFSDSQFGHVFAWGETREQARRSLVIALKEMSIRGEFSTSVDYLVGLLEDKVFISNTTDTGWLDRLIDKNDILERGPDPLVAVICAVIHIADARMQHIIHDYAANLTRGRVPPLDTFVTEIPVSLVYGGVKYVVSVAHSGPHTRVVLANGSALVVDVQGWSDNGKLMSFGGMSHIAYLSDEELRYRLLLNGKTVCFEKKKEPSLVRANGPCKLVRFLEPDGAHVSEGTACAEVEVMKMIMQLPVAASGILRHTARPGSALTKGDVIATVQIEGPSNQIEPIPFTGSFDIFTQNATATTTKVHQTLSACFQRLANIMDGYITPEPFFTHQMERDVDEMVRCLNSPRLPFHEVGDVLAALSGRIPMEVEEAITAMVVGYSTATSSVFCVFPAQQIERVVDQYGASLTDKNARDGFYAVIQPLVETVSRYDNGLIGRKKAAIRSLLQRYYDTERTFNLRNRVETLEQAVARYRTRVPQTDDPKSNKLAGMLFSHASVPSKNKLVLLLLDQLCKKDGSHIHDQDKAMLQLLVRLTGRWTGPVTRRARQLLIQSLLPPFSKRRLDLEVVMRNAMDDLGLAQQGKNQLQSLVDQQTAVFDVLTDIFYHKDLAMRLAALEIYVRRAYVGFKLFSVNVRSSMQAANHMPHPWPEAVVEWVFEMPLWHPSLQRLHREKSLRGQSNMDFIQMIEGSYPDMDQHSIHSLTNSSSYLQSSTTSLSSLALDDSARLHKRMGVMAVFETFGQCVEHFSLVVERLPYCPSTEPLHVVSIALKAVFADSIDTHGREPFVEKADDAAISARLRSFVESSADVLAQRGVRRITFLVICHEAFPKYFTYRAREDWTEAAVLRHLEPALAIELESHRLKAYEISRVPTANSALCLFYGVAKEVESPAVVFGDDEAKKPDCRFFIRSIIRHADLSSRQGSVEFFLAEGERLLNDAIEELELAMADATYAKADRNHTFLNFVPTVVIDPIEVISLLREVVIKHAVGLLKVHVAEAEIRVNIRGGRGSRHPEQVDTYRYYVQSESGQDLEIELYREDVDRDTATTTLVRLAEKQETPTYTKTMIRRQSSTSLHRHSAGQPYAPRDYMQACRSQAQSKGTTYVYDWLELMQQECEVLWQEHTAHSQQPAGMQPRGADMSVVHLMLDASGALVQKHETPDFNDCGVVAWLITLYTPEYPTTGRQVVVIANDITVVLGSFSPREYRLFQLASQLASTMGVPQIFLAANSGARIGLAQEVKEVLQVAWKNNQPELGIDYLYVTEADYTALNLQRSVTADRLVHDTEVRYRITDIHGLADGLGVENLQNSGLLAGQQSSAYRDNITLTLVSARSVGIGAYLARLGQRVIQVEPSHIILTGHKALNKVLGREVYTSSQQLGGPDIMYSNGVTHMVVPDDRAGMNTLLRWLSYLPPARGQPLPYPPPNMAYDPPERLVEFVPTPQGYDPRHMIGGHKGQDGGWVPGFFDKDSFMETLGGWGKTVVVGRARLGGVPLGVVAVETRTVEKVIPADPAFPDSQTRRIQQAGQVWFPDSSYKTAQAIADFNKEELPLMIFANWRGFSGGTRDMYEQVLKFGAMIVDSLRTYTRPVFVYIPPAGELRGGAWVVVDPAINPEMMEMYAAENSRGGVLEPEGTMEIKYRHPDIIKTMIRCDKAYADLHKKHQAATSPEDKASLQHALKQREDELLPVYYQVALTFCDLHDTPGRMKAKGCVSAVLKWKTSREFFYWRVRRRLAEDRAIQQIVEAGRGHTEWREAQQMLQRWWLVSLDMQAGDGASTASWGDDKYVVTWLERNRALVDANVNALACTALVEEVIAEGGRDEEVAMQAILRLAQGLGPDHMASVVAALTK